MDIAKYIGLFLVKNEYCYLPGIGSLQVIKKPSQYDKEAEAMKPSEYTVVFEQGFGAIDDNFANFIANNERISIVHASNYLKDFCKQAKEQLKEGAEIEIPAIGKFKMDAEQAIHFETDPHLNVKGRPVPVFKSSLNVEQRKQEALTKIIQDTKIKEPKSDEEIVIKPPTVNWSKIILLAVIVLGVLVVIGYFIYNLSNKNVAEIAPPEKETTVANKTIKPQENTRPQIKTTQKDNSFMVAVNQYKYLNEAESRKNQLNGYGLHTLLWTKDSTAYYVVFKLSSSIDKTKAIDSLKVLYNPGGDVKVVGQ